MLTSEPDEFADVLSANFSGLRVEADVLNDSVEFVQVFCLFFIACCTICLRYSDLGSCPRIRSISCNIENGNENVTMVVRCDSCIFSTGSLPIVSYLSGLIQSN